MRSVVCYEVPIEDFMGDDVFNQQLFFESCVDKETFLQVVELLDERDSQYEDYLETWKEVKQVASTVKEANWPCLSGSVVKTGTLAQHDKLGDQILSCTEIPIFPDDVNWLINDLKAAGQLKS